MPVDTAQPAMAADPNVQLANAAEAFKAFTSEAPIERPRDDKGRFAPAEGEQDLDEGELEPEAEDDVEQEAEAEADEESQPEPVEMPTSWSKEDAELWESLPADAQGKIAEREAQREQAVNQKFQEAANVRKETETQLAEANANRDAYKQAIDEVLSLVSPVKPDPRAYGAGTGNYNREAYDLAVLEFEQQSTLVTQLRQQQQAIAAQQEEETARAYQAEIAAIEEVARPRFVADVPELTDPAKAPQVLSDIVQYAIEAGIPPSVNASRIASLSKSSVMVRRTPAVPSRAAAVAAVASAATVPPREPLPLIHELNERRVRAVVVLPAVWPVLPSRMASMSRRSSSDFADIWKDIMSSMPAGLVARCVPVTVASRLEIWQ